MRLYFGVPGLEGLWWSWSSAAGSLAYATTRRRWYRGPNGLVRSTTRRDVVVTRDGRRVSTEAWQDAVAELGRSTADAVWGPRDSWRRP